MIHENDIGAMLAKIINGLLGIFRRIHRNLVLLKNA